MELTRPALSRARRARDARFDGRFFIGVRTTGVYCRPVCPAPMPKEANVRYFPTAAAAAEAGFRPCLRCRPEASPGTPAWLGTSVTVARALRLLGERALDDSCIEDLAERLGVGSRHLRRLFVQHLGATPIAVAQTRRLHFAKKLIDETDLPFAELAFAAGFGSIRRFNGTFRGVYDRTPTELRRLARRNGVPRGDRFVLRLTARPPFDWDGLLGFLGARAIPGVEQVEEGVYRRTLVAGAVAGFFEARGTDTGVALEIHHPDAAVLAGIVERARRVFDLNADPHAIDAHLALDPLLKTLVKHRPGLRVPGAWDGFELAVRAVLGQQISVAAATTIAGRIVRAHGRPVPAAGTLTHVFPDAATLARADLGSIGVTRARAATLRRLAEAVRDGAVSFEGALDSGRVREALLALPGIGPWTAQYVAMRALGEPDAFPTGDLGLLHATGLKSAKELEQRSNAWHPWRAYAAIHLWTGGQHADGK